MPEPTDYVAEALKDYERYGRDESNAALMAAIRDPDTSEVYRGICRVELWSRKRRGENIPEDVF